MQFAPGSRRDSSPLPPSLPALHTTQTKSPFRPSMAEPDRFHLKLLNDPRCAKHALQLLHGTGREVHKSPRQSHSHDPTADSMSPTRQNTSTCTPSDPSSRGHYLLRSYSSCFHEIHTLSIHPTNTPHVMFDMGQRSPLDNKHGITKKGRGLAPRHPLAQPWTPMTYNNPKSRPHNDMS